MKVTSRCLLLAGAALAALLAQSAAWGQRVRDVSLVLYPITASDKTLAASATMALKASLKQGQNVTVIEFRPELPSVRRSVIEGTLAKADLDAANDEAMRRVARALDSAYYVKGSVQGDAQSATLVVTAVETRSGRKYDYNSRADSPDGDRNTIMLSVANTVATQFMTQVLNVVPPAAPVTTPLPLPAPEAQPEKPSTTSDKGAAAPPAPAAPEAPPTPRTTPDALVDSAAGYAAQAETLEAAGDLAGAIQAMREAVNLSPRNAAYRVRLARLYEARSMPAEARSEMERAAELDPGSIRAPDNVPSAAGNSEPPADAIKAYREALEKDPKNLQTRIALGDALWNDGKPDDAALEYAQAANDHPNQPDPYYRLARLAAARGQFMDTAAHVSTAKHVLNQSDGAPVEAGLYRSLIQSADMAYYRQKDLLDTLEKDYSSRSITREDYYKQARALLTEVEQLADFLSDLNAPAGYAKAHLHRSLAASLMAQSVTSLQEWLRKDEAALKQNAQGFLRDSQAEMDSAAAIERKLKAG